MSLYASIYKISKKLKKIDCFTREMMCGLAIKENRKLVQTSRKLDIPASTVGDVVRKYCDHRIIAFQPHSGRSRRNHFNPNSIHQQNLAITTGNISLAMGFFSSEATGKECRFPKKTSTVSNHNQLQERTCIGLMSCPVCVKCGKVVPPTSTGRVCSECQTELYKASCNVPRKIYLYNSVTITIKNFMVRPGFVAPLAKWKSRQEIPGRYMDIYDGAVWKTFKTDPTHSVPFVEESIYNLMFTLNVDWFQPYKGSQHSTVSVENLSRDERNPRKNVLLVQVKQRLLKLANFWILWLALQHGVSMHTDSNGVVNVKAALSIVGCDLPAAKKVSGFTTINSKNPCHKCHMPFPACPN